MVKRPIFEEFLKGGADVHVRQTGEVIDVREDKTWKGRESGDEGGNGPQDREEVHQGRETSVRNEQAAYLADPGRPICRCMAKSRREVKGHTEFQIIHQNRDFHRPSGSKSRPAALERPSLAAHLLLRLHWFDAQCGVATPALKPA